MHVSGGDQICSHKDLKTPRKLIHNSAADLLIIIPDLQLDTHSALLHIITTYFISAVTCTGVYTHIESMSEFFSHLPQQLASAQLQS